MDNQLRSKLSPRPADYFLGARDSVRDSSHPGNFKIQAVGALHRKVAGGIERSSVRDPDNLGLRGSSLVPQGRGGQERRDSFQLHQHQQSDSDSDGSPLRAPRYQPSGHHPDGLRSKMLTGLSRNGSSLLPTPLPPTGPPGRGRSSPIAQQQGRTVGRTNSQTCDVQRKPSFTTRYGVPFGSEGNPSRGRSPDASSGCPSSLPEPTTPVDMLVEAVRSKENSRLVQVVQQLRDLDSGEVLGINDCHELTGRTPLHEAVALARLSSVQLLLNYGANPNVCHPTRGPPILHAAAWAEDQLIAILLKNGADINAEDCTGQTALHCACAAGHASSTQLLLESSPSPRAAASGLRLAPGADSGSSFSGAQRPPSGRERRRMSGVCLADILEAVQEDSIAQHQPTPSQVTTNQQAQPADDNHSPMSRAGSQVAMSPQPTHNPRTTISKAENSVPASDSWRQPSSADVERSESSNQQVRRRTRQSLGDSETGLRNTRQPGGESPDNGPLYDLDGPRRPLLPGPRSNVEGAGRAGAAARDAAVPLLVLDHSPPSTPGTARSGGSGTLVSPSPGSGTLRSPSPRTPKTPLWRVGLSPRPGSGRSPAAAIDTVEHITKAMGTPRQGLEMRANQLFHQSVEVETGDVHWTKGELLGEGAYGKVFVGLNQQNGELMAVKEMILAGTKNSPEQRVQLESLEREISLYRNIQHRHVVGYIAAHMDFEASKLYIFLEYVPGGSIATMLERFGAFSEQLVANYTRQLLLGLEYLHGCKVIHRDVKGANVLVTRDGRVKLADFGASKAYHETTVTDGMKSIRGSVYWMAPEMLKGVGYGRRADIWSVGCTVIEMLTGKHPWPDLDNHWSAMFAIAKTESGPPLPDNISDDCRDFLQRCLKHDPRERPTATELLQHAFGNLSDGTTPQKLLSLPADFQERLTCLGGEKAALKKIKAKENKAKANPKLAADNKASADAKRARRAESGSSKTFK
ncbi:hypothetical protein WJX72_006759 [[Myrmecia] bisecta]|uniref:mitogen-activated protein kinase kinase kinase n=1 Tax=[Myrmecia] bisecta TaxID=41462 RepID=A0AAW1PX38_9CHLO